MAVGRALVRMLGVGLAIVVAATSVSAAPRQRRGATHARRAAHTQTPSQHRRAATRKTSAHGLAATRVAPSVAAASAASPESSASPPALFRKRIAPLTMKAPAPSLRGATFVSAAPVLAVTSDHVNLVGVIEAPNRELRLAVFSIDGRIVHGRIGDVVGERYRVRAFTEHEAELIDEVSDGLLNVAAAPAPEAADLPPAAAPSASAGALRVVGQPEIAEIYVDGAYVGTVGELSEALEGVPLESGAHQVDLQAPDTNQWAWRSGSARIARPPTASPCRRWLVRRSRSRPRAAVLPR